MQGVMAIAGVSNTAIQSTQPRVSAIICDIATPYFGGCAAEASLGTVVDVAVRVAGNCC